MGFEEPLRAVFRSGIVGRRRENLIHDFANAPLLTASTFRDSVWHPAWKAVRPQGPPHNSLNRDRFKDKIMQHFKVLQRPLRVFSDARRCRARKGPAGA
ncbi:hypothetical protein ELH53_20560 [Rhizobium ruizarguesonis]|nr:hypothetical protein ELH53_20560 [Rhizobium ruizarguesonis]